MTDPKASFGFREIPTAQKQGLVRNVFDRVAARYDLMNDIMSMGAHRIWKAHMVNRLPLAHPNQSLLDVAGGTGDIAFRALKKARQALPISVMDINAEMLSVGRKRAAQKGYAKNIRFTQANAEALPLADESVTIYTIALGIRNVTYREKTLLEAWRVLQPGGFFACLELSHMPEKALQKLYDRYSFSLIPQIGKLIVGDSEPYQYLIESIRQFPAAAQFAQDISAAGFANVRYDRLSGGVAALHYGQKL